MHIALYTHSRLPVRGYGGTQRVVVWLARGLAELGHRVTLLAAAGSRVPEAELSSSMPTQIRRPGFDLTRFLPTSVDICTPTPLSLPLQPRRCIHPPWQSAARKPGRPQHHLPERRPCPAPWRQRRSSTTAWIRRSSSFDPQKADYDLFLGRLHRVKGYRWAVPGRQARWETAGCSGRLAAELRRSLRFVGSVDGQQKAALLAGAACLWMPALWDEPFGLTLVEAMMSGTPVLGTRRGALPEIVLRSGRRPGRHAR